MSIFTHIPFLRSVLVYSFTAFGGPQGHYLAMLRIFVDQRKDLTEKELLDYNTFCSLLPGASSTQILLLIAHKKGGIALSIITLCLWVLPATMIMGSLSLFLTSPKLSHDPLNYFRFLQPMVVGFIIYTGYRSFLQISEKKVLIVLAGSLASLCLLFYKSPLIIPIVLIVGGAIARYLLVGSERVSVFYQPRVRWLYLTLFISFFITSGALSELAKKNSWTERAYFNLFENCYRFGSMVFGGGDVMIPIMYEQYVARPSSQRIKTRNQNVLKIEKELFLSGAGLVRSIPGPVFSFASFAGGASMSGKGYYHQIGGIVIATIAIFLPSLLLVLFFHPFWEYMHRFENLYSILKGVQVSTVAIMIASALYLSKDSLLIHSNETLSFHPLNTLCVLLTLFFLKFHILSPIFITLTFLTLGILF